MWPQMVFLVIAIIAIGLLALITMILGSRRRHEFDKQEYQTRWLKIENSIVKTDPRSFSMAIIEADKLLDRALTEMNVPGKSMGEKLKKMEDRIPEINRVWYAHKVRNQIVHDSDFRINYKITKQALSIFRQALMDLGAI